MKLTTKRVQVKCHVKIKAMVGQVPYFKKKHPSCKSGTGGGSGGPSGGGKGGKPTSGSGSSLDMSKYHACM